MSTEQSNKQQMAEDALNKALSCLPVLKRLIRKEIPLTTEILPWYERKAWKFSIDDSRHIVVVVGGRSEDPSDDAYLSHISWRKSDEGTFRTFQADWASTAAEHNRMIVDWFKPVRSDIGDEPAPQKKMDYVITKEPDRVYFACKTCGCEFNLPANECERTTTTGSGWKHGGRTYVWHHANCPCCNAACTKEYRQPQC